MHAYSMYLILECELISIGANNIHSRLLNCLTFSDDGGLIPYFCDWKGATNHASGRLPVMGDFGKLKVTAPADSPLHKLLDGFTGIQIETGVEQIDFEFSTATGSHSFTTSQPIGITFPK
jgi:hypothetical protein